jgi:hypothetical protein
VAPRMLSTPRKDPVPIVQEAGWNPGPVWTGVENLAPPGFDPGTVQPVASRYTRSTLEVCIILYFHEIFLSHEYLCAW